MIEMRKHIRKSLSTMLSVDILIVVALVFMLALGSLYYQSRNIIREESIEEASHVLDNTALRAQGCLSEVETATHNMLWLIDQCHDTDSLLEFSRRVVSLHPNVNGCSITMEPDYYPNQNYGFSAYSVRTGDTVTTVREADYDYYNKVWYKTPRQKDSVCWVDPFDDFNDGTLSSPEMIASYCVPLHEGRRFIGVISTDLSLNKLNATITVEHPYAHSYCMMLGADGHYFVHPDTAKILKQTIFSAVDPKEHPDIVALGHQITKGHTGHMEVEIDGKKHIVLYRPLAGTQWSVALVCPSEEMLRGYNRLNYILLPLAVVGLLLLVLGCRRIVRHFIQPLGQLARELRQIGSGEYEQPLPPSSRTDVIGQLQNSFCEMQQSISKHIHEAQQHVEEAERRTRELEQATLLAKQASEQKTQFMQDMSHQIRTPLNIVHGFAQVVSEGCEMISADEKRQIAETMYVQTNALDYMVSKLLTTSVIENRNTIDTTDIVSCNQLAREAIAQIDNQVECAVDMKLVSDVGDEFTITTNRQFLLLALMELLFNAYYFARESSILLRVEAADGDGVRFAIEDHGPGIPADKVDIVFDKFTKLNMFTEGLGIGLYLCRRIVNLMGGTLTLDTQYAGGSRFVIAIG